MLVLSRQRDETIMIGDDIEITLVDIRGDKVRIGISAPQRVSVHRKEVYDAIIKENEQAAAAITDVALPKLVPQAVPARGKPPSPTRAGGRSGMVIHSVLEAAGPAKRRETA